MSVVDTLKARALAAMKAKDSVATTIFRLALSEVQTLEARTGKTPSEEEAQGTIRKLCKSNEETANVTQDADEKAKLVREIELLRELLPKNLSIDEIRAALSPVADAIKAAPAAGPAMGMAMKHLKSVGASAEAADVTAAVNLIRG